MFISSQFDNSLLCPDGDPGFADCRKSLQKLSNSPPTDSGIHPYSGLALTAACRAVLIAPPRIFGPAWMLFLCDLNTGGSLCIEILRHAFLPWLIRRDRQRAFLNLINRFARLAHILGKRTFRNRRDELSRRNIFRESERALVPIIGLRLIA